MQIKKGLVAFAIALMSLTSCGKDVGIPRGESLAGEEYSLSVTLGAEEGANEFRLAQQVGNDGAIVRPLAVSRNFTVRLLVRKKGDSRVKIQDVVFKNTSTNSQPLRATYTGKIKIPEGLVPHAGDAYQISGLVLKGTDPNVEYLRPEASLEGYVSTVPNTGLLIADAKKTIDTKIPYIADWTDIKVTKDIAHFAATTMRFKPRGSIIRFRLHNKSAETRVISSIKIKTNTFFTDWRYASQDPFAKGNLMMGSRSDVNMWEKVYPLPGGDVTLNAKTGVSDKFYYMWVMPAASGAQTRLDITATGKDGKSYEVFASNNALKAGGTLLSLSIRPSKAVFPGGRLPTEWFAEYNVAPDGVSFAKSHKNDASGYFSRVRTLTQINYAFPGYHLPLPQEWAMVFPPDAQYLGAFGEGRFGPVNVNAENVELPIGTLGAMYRGEGNGTLYGIRFIGKDNRYLTAFRYRVIGNFVEKDLDSHLEVRAKYLGPDFVEGSLSFGAMDRIMPDEFWADAGKPLIFPAAGMMHGGRIRERGIHGSYWLRAFDIDAMTFNRLHLQYQSLDASSNPAYGESMRVLLPVRLMRGNPTD